MGTLIVRGVDTGTEMIDVTTENTPLYLGQRKKKNGMRIRARCYTIFVAGADEETTGGYNRNRESEDERLNQLTTCTGGWPQTGWPEDLLKQPLESLRINDGCDSFF
jgi:hypothetical protein